jgi:hypothetical protein
MTSAPAGNPLGADRLFKTCAYCARIALMSWYGRRWLCDDCAKENGLR